MPTLTYVSTVAALAAITSPTAGDSVQLTQAGREGLFVFDSSNLSTIVSEDTRQGLYVAPAGASTGASGAWVRKNTNGIAYIEWFGPAANGDVYNPGTDTGGTNDRPVLVDAIDLIRLLRGVGVFYTELRLTKDKTYLVYGSDPVSILLNFSNFTIDGQGATLRNRRRWSASLFTSGNDLYETGVDESIPEYVVLKNINWDATQQASATTFLAADYPCRHLWIDNCTAYQSRYGNNTEEEEGDTDCWFINLEVNQLGSPTDADAAADANARNHDVQITNCRLRDKIQLTGGCGRGVNGFRAYDNEIRYARANGITFGSSSKIYRVEDVWIERNYFFASDGRSIMCGPDVLTARQMISPLDTTWRHYMRNVNICNNVFEDDPEVETGQHIYVTYPVQGAHDILVKDNIHRATMGAAIRVNSGNSNYGWKAIYQGGVDPVIAATDFDATNNRVFLEDHNLQHATGVKFKPEASGAMPAGVCADIFYFVGLIDDGLGGIDPDYFELYESIDAATGELANKVDIQSGASGNFTVFNGAICTNLDLDGVFHTGTESVLADIRGGRIGGIWHLNERILAGGMADVVFCGEFNARVSAIDFSEGGCQRVAFDGARVFSRGNSATGDSRHLVRALFASDAHYDLAFANVHVEVDYDGAIDRASPTRFFEEGNSDFSDPTTRKGPGWTAGNITSRYRGSPSNGFINFGSLAAKNCAGLRNVENPNGSVNNPATAYTLTLGDEGRTLRTTSTSSTTITVPPNSTVAFPVGARIKVVRANTGAATLAEGSGVTINSKGSLKSLAAQYSDAWLEKSSTNTWLLTGDLA